MSRTTCSTPEAETELEIIGEGALLAQLTRARDRSMHSIVATIQAEQDKAIRAPNKGVVSISGGPGTGKTVVALHRAAYLLYGDRRRYESGGVLVVGPSGVFMRYIERVLPSLGETAVALRSLGEVVDGVRATRRDEPAAAEIKGSAAMAELLRRTARQAVPDAPREFRVFYRDDVITLDARELGSLRRQLLSRSRRNQSTTRVASTLIDAMWRQVRSERGRDRTKEDFSAELRTDDLFLEFAAAWWPVLDAATVLGWLRDPDLLARVAEGVLDDEAVRVLSKSWGDTLSVDDIPLLDELRYLLGDPPIVNTGSVDDEYLAAEDASLHEVFTASDREYAGPRGWTPPTNRVEDDGFAHVLVDEAQDLTPMQWRMVGRRGRGATWTVVGDPAQSSWPVPAESAAAREAALGDKPRHDFHLSTNYRNSSEIYDFAADVRRPGGSGRRPSRRGALDRGRAGRAARGRPGVGGAHAPDRARRVAGGDGRGGRAQRPPRRGDPLGLLVARGGLRVRHARLAARRTHRAGHEGPRVRRHRRRRSRRRSRTRPPPAAPPSTSSTPAPPSGWSPSPSSSPTGHSSARVRRADRAIRASGRRPGSPARPTGSAQKGGGPTIRMLPVASAACRMRSRSSGSAGSPGRSGLAGGPVEVLATARGVQAEHPGTVRAGQEGMGHLAGDHGDPAGPQVVLVAVDVEQHRAGQEVEGLLGLRVDVQGRALAGLDGVLEEQEAVAGLALADQPGVQPATVEPAALGFLGVPDERRR